jgi:hypothetical protein
MVSPLAKTLEFAGPAPLPDATGFFTSPKRFQAKQRVLGFRRGKADLGSCSERVAVGFPGSNPQRMVDWRHEYLTVANLPGAGAGRDHLDGPVGDI